MRLLPRSVVVLLSLIATIPGTLSAAEVTNVTTRMTNTHLTMEYDLVGKEKESSVDVQVEIKGKRYTSNMLSLSGDFGRSIAPGTKHEIIWAYPQDFPEGMEEAVECHITAIPDSGLINESSVPSEGYRSGYLAVNSQTIVDTQTRLMWSRSANISRKPMKYTDVQAFIKRLNRERFAGYSDWRIPTREELERLIFLGKKNGWGYEIARYIADYLATCGFSPLPPGNYWTSTPPETGTGQMLVMNTWNGAIRALDASSFYYPWPVRNMP